MVFHGRRFIVAEFGAGVLFAGALGVLSMVQGWRLLDRGVTWQLVLGGALLWIALNYVPLFIHALDLARHGTARDEVAAELSDLQVARSYAWRQLWILVPLGVVAQDLMQRSARRLGGGR